MSDNGANSIGLDNAIGPVILHGLNVGPINRQTVREGGAQSEGPRSPEVAWLPKPNMLKHGVNLSFRSASTYHRRDRGVRWSVGPGLFLALALLAPAGRAETAAGLDAQGVDPRTAVENKYGLDVRDERGRPVTSAQVLSDLKGAAVKRAADNAFTSSLPKARAILSALEVKEFIHKPEGTNRWEIRFDTIEDYMKVHFPQVPVERKDD